MKNTLGELIAGASARLETADIQEEQRLAKRELDSLRQKRRHSRAAFRQPLAQRFLPALAQCRTDVIPAAVR